jgi:hypothetical protein
MTRTSSRRLPAALVLIALVSLCLPASASPLGHQGRVPTVLAWIHDWAESLWSLLPGAPDHSANRAVGMDGSTTTDRGALIDPNGSPGGR